MTTSINARAFMLDLEALHLGCQTRRRSQLADDCLLIGEKWLRVYALRAKTDFTLHHETIAVDLGISEARVKKAIARLLAVEAIRVTRRQTMGHGSRFALTGNFAAKASTSTLRRELAAATRAAQAAVFNSFDD